MENIEGDYRHEVSQAIRAVKALGSLIRRREKAARRACDDLLSRSPEDRDSLIGDGRATRIRSRPVAEELIRRMRKEAFRNPARAEELGVIVEDLLCCMPRTAKAVGGERGWQDLSARLWAHRGNVARIRCFWQRAHDCFRRACRHLERGGGDLQLKAEVFRLLASLCKDRRLHEQALSFLRTAEEIYQELEDPVSRGKTLIKRAAVYRGMKEYEMALSTHLEACKLLESFEEPELGAAAWSNLAVHFCDLGKPQEAEQILRQTKPLFRLCSRRSTVHLNRSWVGAMAAHGLGRLEEAETLYRSVRRAYRDIEHPYNEALVSLDLATLYTEQNRLDDLAFIAEETYAGLRNQDLNPEAEQALQLFVEAARRRRVAVEVIRAAAEQLSRRRSCCGGVP